MKGRYNDELVDFFDALAALGNLFGAALENYLNEEYNKVETVDDQQQPEPADECYCEDCDKCCDECKVENNQPADECPDCEDTAGPSNYQEVRDEYKLIISDYTVKTYEDALRVMTPKLNALTFAMRTFAYSDAFVEFRFTGVIYKFAWDKEDDRFIGFEDNSLITKEVFWDELSNQVKDLQDEPTVEGDAVVESPKNDCPYKQNSFYPYGEKCKDCPDKDKCFAKEEEVESNKKSESAVYDAAGNAINEKEIPSLKDYVENDTVQSEPGYDSGYGEVASSEEPTPENEIKELNKGVGKVADDHHITAQDIYKKVNEKYISMEECAINTLLIAVEKLLKSNIYSIIKDEQDVDIHKIKFTIGQLQGCITGVIMQNIEDTVYLPHLAEAIKTRFGFSKVEIYDGTIYCDLR